MSEDRRDAAGAAREDELLERLLEAEAAGRDPELPALLERLGAGRRDAFRERIEGLARIRLALRRRGGAAPASPGPELAPGDTDAFLNLTVGKVLGRGSLGVVYEAFDRVLDRTVAVKVLKLGTPEAVLAEARRAAALHHPAIVTVHSIAEGRGAAGAAGIVMERIHGTPLDRAARGLARRRLARLFKRVAEGLAAAHEHGLVHRDLKPDNVLVTGDLRPKILDFGLALSRGAPRAADGLFRGTPLFAAPEQARGEEVGPAADLFAFGGMLYQALTGFAPFEGASLHELFSNITTVEPRFPRDLDGSIPAGLQAITLACLSKDPRRRPTARLVAENLGGWLSGAGVRVRPALYGDILRRDLGAQMEQLADWQRQEIITAPDADRLRTVLRRVLADEDHWIVDAQKLTFRQMLLHAGIWLVVVSVALLVWRGRDQLEPLLRALLPGAACLLLLALGLRLRALGRFGAAAVLLAGAVLAALPAALSLLAENDLLPRPAPPAAEELAAAPADEELAAAPAAATISQLLPAPYSNAQIFAASAFALLLALLGLRLARSSALAWTTATLTLTTWYGWLLTRGLLDFEPEVQALWSLPLVALVIPALAAEAKGRVRWALPFHLAALLAFVLAVDVIAVNATTLEWLGLLPDLVEKRSQGYSIALNGLLMIALLIALERSRSLDLRRGARILEFLAPLHLLGPLYSLAGRKHAPFTDMAAYLGGVVLFLLLGPWRNHRRLLIAGLIGIAFGCHLLIEQEFVRPVPFLVILGAAGFLGVRTRSAA